MDPLFHSAHILHVVHLDVDFLIAVVLLTHDRAVGDHHATAGIVFLAAEALILFLQHLHIRHAHGDARFGEIVLGRVRHKGAHHHQLELAGLLVAIVVISGEFQGEFVLVDVYKGRDRVPQRVGLTRPALALAAVVALSGILELIGKIGAYQHGDLLFAQVHVIGDPAAALQLKLHGLQRVHVHAVTIPQIRFIPVALAGVDIAVHGVGGIERRGRHHMLVAAECFQHFVVQLGNVACGAVGIVIDLDLGQIAPALQHGFVLGVAGDAKADHNDDGEGAHHHADNGQGCAAFAPPKIIRAEAQQIRYLHLRPPALPVSSQPSSCGSPPRRPQQQRPHPQR